LFGQGQQQPAPAVGLPFRLQSAAIKPGLPVNPAVIGGNEKLLKEYGLYYAVALRVLEERLNIEVRENSGDGISCVPQQQGLGAPLAMLDPAVVLAAGKRLRRQNFSIVTEPADPRKWSAGRRLHLNNPSGHDVSIDLCRLFFLGRSPNRLKKHDKAQDQGRGQP